MENVKELEKAGMCLPEVCNEYEEPETNRRKD